MIFDEHGSGMARGRRRDPRTAIPGPPLRDRLTPRDWSRPWADRPGFFFSSCKCCTPTCNSGNTTTFYLVNVGGSYIYNSGPDSWSAKSGWGGIVANGVSAWNSCYSQSIFLLGAKFSTRAYFESYVDDTWTAESAPSTYAARTLVGLSEGQKLWAFSLTDVSPLHNSVNVAYTVASNSWATDSEPYYVYQINNSVNVTGVIDASVYVPGGFIAGGSRTNATQVFNTSTGGWITGPNLPVAIADTTVFQFYSSSYFHVAFGSVNPGTTYVKTNYRFDGISYTSKTQPTYGHTLGFGMANNSMGIAGRGADPTSGFTAHVDTYDPASDTWTRKNDTSTANGFGSSI